MFKRGDRWYSDFWYKRERYKKSWGPVSKTIAKEKDRALRSDVASGDHAKRKSNLSFSAAIKEHLKRSKAENQKSTYARNKSIASHLQDHFKDKRISSIENNEILMRQYVKNRKEQIRKKQLKQGRNETEVTYTSINRELAFLRSMFNVLIKSGKARTNPVTLVKFFEEVQKERVLTPEEESTLFQTIEKADVRYHHLKDIVTVALNTAMRQGEILKMMKSWIDLNGDIITVPRYAMKRKNKDKRIPINSAISPILKRRIKAIGKGDGYIFVNPKTGTRFNSIQNSFDGILKKAKFKGKPGVDKIRFHDLRHTAATKLARAGKDMKFIAQYLGHTDVRTSARYVHYSDEDMKRGSEILAQVPPDSTPVKSKRSQT
jgi:integrase